jgi:hypothetical protein
MTPYSWEGSDRLCVKGWKNAMHKPSDRCHCLHLQTRCSTLVLHGIVADAGCFLENMPTGTVLPQANLSSITQTLRTAT